MGVVAAGQGLGHPCGTEMADGAEISGRFLVDGPIGTEVPLPTRPGGSGQAVRLTVVAARAKVTVADRQHVKLVGVGA